MKTLFIVIFSLFINFALWASGRAISDVRFVNDIGESVDVGSLLLKTNPGEDFVTGELIEDVDTLKKALSQYKDIITQVNPDGEDKLEVVFLFQKKRQVRSIRILFNKDIQNAEHIRDALNLHRGSLFDSKKMEDDKRILFEEISRLGFDGVKVKHELNLASNDRDVELTYHVESNTKQLVIENVEFTGNSSFKSRNLKKQIKSRPRRFFLEKKTEFEFITLERDIEAVQAFYVNQGFLDVTVSYDYKVKQQNRVDVEISIVEGDRYYVEEIEIDHSENYSHTYRWHYTDWPDPSRDYNRTHNNGTLVAAIENQIKVLSDKKAAKADRAFALKFLVHLVGDIHQPLHVGNGMDRGGNRCKVIFHKEETNLHKLWDENMIEFTRLSFTEYANFIDIKAKKDYKQMREGTPLSWAKESAQLRPQLYPEEVAPTDQKKGTTPYLRNYCNKGLNLPTEQLPKIGYGYSYKLVPLMERRMLEAGIRLAHLINQAL